ncbi:helix-turn-helix domain-containing protein [Aminipila sp.]|uniref:helix-turn-helix domain-containing protein n=1 Tax=Aminipila sp. TaxID=2060095 RepID=UPI00289ABFE3|nr:helix-turn-helix transcriptional regulator [Aminipila sp.]
MFGENLKTIRNQKGMSQETLAQQLNVVRQTISKWEKGLSVPDAEMLTRISDLFEIPVSQLLGVKIEAEKNTNEVAAQLAILNEQLANKSRRNKNIFKIALRIIAVFVIAYIVFAVAAHVTLKNNRSDTQTTTLICTMDNEEYTYAITYDEQYQIIEAGGNAFIADHVETEKYDDANILIAQIEDYFGEHGGTCERVENH